MDTNAARPEQVSARQPLPTLLDIVKKTTEFFATKKIDSPRLTAELLIGHALGLKRMQLYVQFEKPLTDADLDKIRPLVRRRGQREPLQYILGETEWGGMRLKVDRRALIPRPETEYLLELIGQAGSAAPARILDLGTGSGALALGLARLFPEAKVVGLDLSAEALVLAGENAIGLGLGDRVEWLRSDWFQQLPEGAPFDLIVANPPYLSEAETDETEAEIRAFEPRAALASPENGLADLKKIIADAPRFLSATGWLALETGIHHHEAVTQLCREGGFTRTESKKDLTNRDRFVFAFR